MSADDSTPPPREQIKSSPGGEDKACEEEEDQEGEAEEEDVLRKGSSHWQGVHCGPPPTTTISLQNAASVSAAVALFVTQDDG